MLNPENYVESKYCDHFFIDCQCCNKEIELNFDYFEEEGFYTYEELRDMYDEQVIYMGGDPEFLICSFCFFELIDVKNIDIDFPYIENVLEENGGVVNNNLSENDKKYNSQILKNIIVPKTKKLLSKKTRAGFNGGVF